MKHKMQWLLPALLALLALTGCSLARPEAGSGGDRFVGFYLVREESGRDFYQNPHLEEYGGETVRLDGYGAINIPREVLFAQKEGEEWVFPGLEGWRLFVYRGFEEDSGTYLSMVTDLAPGEEPPQFKITDEGGVDIISGALYLGPPLGQADWDPYEDRSVWTTYRVYQAPDGRPYLDGSGNSFTGALGSYQESQTYTRQENGGVVEKETVEVSISVKAVPRLEGLVVRQFDGEGGQLSAEDLTLEGELPAVTWLPEAAWALVEERSPEGVVRTAYTRPGPGEEPVTHPVILLDSAGVGSVKDLTIGGQP